MTLSWKRTALWVGLALTWGIFFADYLDRLRRIYEAPTTFLAILRGVVEVISTTSIMAWAIFLLGAACLIVATSDWWWPKLHVFFPGSQVAAAADTALPGEFFYGTHPTNADDSPQPDMSVWEPFYLLEPNYLYLEDHDRIKINQKILDELALGHMPSWGRPRNESDWIDDLCGSTAKPRLKSIPKDYWHDADFTYQFFEGERRGELMHAQPDHNHKDLPSYYGIMFCRASAERALGIKRQVFDAVLVDELRNAAALIDATFATLPNSEGTNKIHHDTKLLRAKLKGMGDLEAVALHMWTCLEQYVFFVHEVENGQSKRLLLDANQEELLLEFENRRRSVRQNLCSAAQEVLKETARIERDNA